jgi:hypothetical protein
VAPWLVGVVISYPLTAQQDTSDYWQQEVHYVIGAALNEGSGVLSGNENIRYVNRSPDTLREFYLHLYLNAFRPGSRWADSDSIAGNRRFNDLRDPDYAFERLGRVRIDGNPVRPEFPYAPDSTIVRFSLPSALAPGDEVRLEVEWQARPSTLPRRQGRRGRRFDFAQWYPRVVTYDRDGWQDHPLYPAGEFYGEFATYDVTLDLAEDQVIGATGIPLEGDPGWEAARADRSAPVNYQRDWYGIVSPGEVSPGLVGVPAPPGCGSVRVAPGRKCVRFHARDVHHFAMSLNPEYIYEEGRFNDVVVRVLYNPEDRDTWGGGRVVGRTEEALRWLDGLFGAFPWPQITNVHRIEGGGTEFPMMVMDGGPGLGLILHEVGHNYLMGILANNEWKEGFLDEGFSSFQSSWYFEEHGAGDGYQRLARQVLDLDLNGWSQPISTPGEEFRDFATYGQMTYSKAQLFYYQLRLVVGDDTMKRILREYYSRWKLKHVTAEAFQSVAEDESGRDLGWLFDQWLHGTPLIDYSIGKVRKQATEDGQWRTTVEVKRRGDGWMPMEVGQRGGPGGEPVVYGRVEGLQPRDTLSFVTREKPGRIVVDPRIRGHDWNMLNNTQRGPLRYRPIKLRFDTFFSEPSSRDRIVTSVAPMAWWNDASDVTVAIRSRTNYLGRYNRGLLEISRGFGGIAQTTTDKFKLFDFYLQYENPLFLRKPMWSQGVAGWIQDGTAGARLWMSKESRSSFASRKVRHTGLQAQWVATSNTLYLDPDLWENAGTIELTQFTEWDLPTGFAHWKLRYDLTGGVGYREGDGSSGREHDFEPMGRLTASISARKDIFLGLQFGARLYGGGYLQKDPPVKQRLIPANGADPYQTLRNPYFRTQGAPLVNGDVFYHAPGNANMRGYKAGLLGRWATSVNLELEKSLYSRDTGWFRGASLMTFWDGASVDTVAVASFSGNFYQSIYDAGAGVRALFHIGDITFPIRVEFPLYVSSPLEAQDSKSGTDAWGFRWLISVQPIF